MARTRSVDFLPQIFQTPVNKQFLSATLDTLTQEPKFKKTQGVIGRTVGPGVNPNDQYVVEIDKTRRDYQLEPGVISLTPDTNNIKNVMTYPGINDAIGFQGGDSTRPDQLYNSDYYAWDPFVNYDAFINFSQYYWLPNGPDTVDVYSTGIPVSDNFVVTRANGAYTFSEQNGTNPTIDLVRGGSYTFQVTQNAKETVNYRVSNQGISSYVINQQNNPTLTLVRGNTYVFNLNLKGVFPFWIKTAQVLGTGSAYDSGVSRNGSAIGLVTFVVPQDAPDTLYYVSENQPNLQGTFNIVDAVPGTGNKFYIQSFPGVDGKNPTTPNQTTREVFGVANNGIDLGTITFEAPQKTAQQFYFNLTDVGPIDLLTTLNYSQINNQPLTEFIIATGGIDGITYLSNRTLVFVNDSLDTNVYQIKLVTVDGLEYITLAAISTVGINEKFSILYGITWSNTGWYKDATSVFVEIPQLTANLDTLYYQDGTDPDIFGTIRLIEPADSSTIDVTTILGKKNYTSPNGVAFTNGLKVRFTGEVTPASYGSGSAEFACTATIAGSNYITTDSTDGLYEGEQIVFPTGTLGGIESGRVYYIKSISANRIQFSISTVVNGPTVSLSTATGTMNAVVTSNLEYYVAGVGTGAGLENRVGFVDGRAYFGPYHTHLGQKMTGTVHTSNFHQFIYNNVIDSITNAGAGGPAGASLSLDGVPDVALGIGIYLIPVRDLVTPETYVVDDNDSTIAAEPQQLDYLTISRASKDLNAWTRSNRWFHISVIQASASYNNTVASLDNDYRAKRPIIEFRPNIRLYNMGTQGKQPVDIIDFDQTDAFSNIQGTSSYSVDGYTFVDGSRVIFAADEDANVRNKIYIVQFIQPDSLPLTTAGNFAYKATYQINTLGTTDWNTAAGTIGITYAVGDIFVAATTGSGTGTAYFDEPIINLVLASDGDVLYDDSVVCLDGTISIGLTFWYDGVTWIEAQQKTGVQQAPLFDVYDLQNISFSNRVKYPSSTFVGSKLFSYAVGDTGILDPVLQFPLQYLNINNVGDIVFENNLYKDTFLYVQDNVSTILDISSGAAREYAYRATYTKLIGWQNAIATSQVYQQFKFTYTGATLKLDVAASTSTVVPAIKIYVGSIFQKPETYSYVITDNSTVITLNNVYLPTDVIEVLVLSDQISNVGFYQVPINLESNPLNGNSPTFTLGTIRTNYESICENLTELTGSINGANNSRDLGNIIPYSLVILQQSSPLTMAGYFLRSEQFNIFSSLQYNSQEYLKFKGQLLNAVTQQNIEFQTAGQLLDVAMADVTLGRVETQPFYWSDMLPSGSTYISNSYTVSYTTTASFPTQQVYNYTSANYLGMDVYLNDLILVRNFEYVVATDGPRITVLVPLTNGDIVTIREYTTTYGNFVPNTPTKLGLYPAWRPQYIEQKTSTGTAVCIVGHDGSITRAFEDVRDDVLLEFEKRIYNNLKLDGNPVPLTIYDVLPGQFRTTGYTLTEINNILNQDFLSYVAWNKLDYRTQDYQANNEFTWNYSSSQGKLDNGTLPAAWRGINRYYYDTQQPELTPWEMLGFSVVPDWWETLYGEGPYTQDNLVLWDDLEAGRVADPAGTYYLAEFARPRLTEVIPTGTQGELLSPFDSVVGTYNAQTFRKSWALGDGSPTEASWWNSSTYPFAVMRLLALTRPAKFFALFADRDLYKFDTELNQYLYNGRYRINAKDIEVYGDGVSKASYIDWIVDYNRQSGINSTATLTAELDFLDVRLCYRMASFSDKQYIKIYTEKSSPNSVNTTLLIPDESYDLVLYKNQPFDRASYSAVVVQKTAGGYAVFGYSKTQPFFNTIGSQYTGQLQTFSSGGVTVQVPTFYTNQIVQVPYGHVFANETATSAFLLGYGEYLQQQGLIFEDSTNGYILSWGQMVNEFLYWSQQGWDENALINLNPLAFKLSVTKDRAVVDSIVAQTNENILLDQNNRELPTRNLIITRLDNNFTVEPATDQTLSSIDIKYTSYEHMIVLNNTSSFGDLIYQPITGARQSRLNLIAATSTEWNGSVDAQGFILNQNNIKDWDPYVTYAKGEIVTYKGTYWSAANIVQPSTTFNTNSWYQSDYTRIELGLLPNLANKADQLSNSYNINTANLETDNDLLSYGLIGFRPRQYMTALNLDDVSQLNIYRQFLGDKGTILSAELFSKVNLGKETGDYTIYENWAVQRAVYGANANRSLVQLRLNRALLSSNPSLVQVINPGQDSQADQTIFLNDIWRQSYRLTSPNILPTTTTLPTDIALPTAGYVNIDDADITVFDINNVDSLAANIDSINVGTTIWVAKTNAYDWNIYRAAAVPGIIAHVCDNLDGTSLVIFTQQHGLTEREKLIIKFFDAEVNGIYDVLSIVSLDKITIAFSFSDSRTVVTGTGIGFTLATQRVAQASDILNLPYANTLQPGAKVWVDDNGSGLWETVQKEEVFSQLTELAPVLTDVNQQYGSSVAQSRDKFSALVGSPRYRFPAGATLWTAANSYAVDLIVYIVDPYQTEFFQASQPVPQGIDIFNASYWTPYSLDSLPRTGGVYVYVKSSATSQYIPISPLIAGDAVLALDVLDNSGGAEDGNPATRGYGYSVDFGNRAWAVAGAPGSLGSTGQADNGYACVIYLSPELGSPDTVPYGQWQLLTTPGSTSADQGQFGYSVAMSLDEHWMYISAPGVNAVYAYGQVDWQNQVINLYGDDATTTYDISNAIQIDAATQLQVSVGGADQTLNVDYTVNGSFTTVTFTTAPAEGDAIQIRRISRKIMDYGSFYDVTQSSTSGSGTGAKFTIVRQRNEVGQGNAPAATVGLVAVSTAGSGYATAQTVTIGYDKFGGTAINGSIVLTINSVNGSGGITGFTIYYAPTVLTNEFSLNEYFFTATNIYSFSVLVDNVLQRPGIDYDFSGDSALGNDLVFINSPARGAQIFIRAEGYFEYANTITVAGLSATDQFGYSVSTSTDGRQVLIGTPYSTQDGEVAAGSVYVFDRNVQKFIYGTADPVSSSFVVLGSVAEPVSVLVNGTFLINEENTVLGATNTFTVSGVTVTINADLQVGDIIEIETNQFAQVQEITQSTPEAAGHFGSAVDLCSYNCSLYSGAPNSSAQQFHGGIVERNINQSRAFGIITATVANPVLDNGDTIRIDNIDVAVPNSPNQNVTGLAAAINAAVPNANATVSTTGYLTIAVKNSAAAATGNKLQVAPGSIGTTFDDLGFKTFVYTQTIQSPYPTTYAYFGTSLSIDDSAVNLVVGAPNGTMYLPTDFDNYTALWDAGASEFFDLLFQSGAVYTFDLLPSSSSSVSNPDKFVFGQQIVNTNIAPYDQYGTSVSYVSGVLLSGAPGNELDDSTMTGNYGRVLVSENSNNVPAWTVLTVEQPVVDIRLLNSVYAYDRITSAAIEYFDFFNPLQGKILGAAKQNLDYIGGIDPASYNVGPTNILGTTWTSGHDGETWWDTSTVRFIDPNQDDIVYASRRWGQLFPGSTVDVYQWIVSDAPPASYTGPGIPRDTLSYVITTALTQTGTFVTEYYFWVRGLTTTATQKGKTLPISTVANYIEDPRASGIAYIAPINASTIALYNAADYIVAQDTILSIEFDRELTESNVHVEYELVPQDKPDGWISNNLYRKLQDSFCGVDTSGNLVPDVNLGPAERYGVQFRPRQSMFIDRYAALKNYLVRANTVLARYPISENRSFNLLNSREPEPSATSGEWDKRVASLEILGFQDISTVPLGYAYLVVSDSRNRGLWTIYTVGTTATSAGTIRSLTLTRVQNYDTRQYWSYIDWYLPGYNTSSQIVATVTNYAGLEFLDVAVGSSVEIVANTQGKYEIYIRTLSGWDRVGLQDGTIEFAAELWDYALGRYGFDLEVFDAQYYDQEPVIETRKIIQAINEELFIDDLLIERNRSLTLMFNFVLSEFSAPGWLIKTSLIDVEHRIRSLLPYQNYTQDNQEFVLDYIQEVKPYHVQVKEFNLIYNGFNEWVGDMTDFDLPSYYNSNLVIPQYTSPILLPYAPGTAVGATSNTLSDLPSSSTVWAGWPYSQWYGNYTLSLASVAVVAGGTGYTIPPTVVFTGNAAEPATAVAVLNSAGEVVSVNVTYAGVGYVATPTVTIEGGGGAGSGAVVYPRMTNEVVRQFRTTIRYDRFQYKTSVQTWSPDGTYENGTLVRYDDRVWSALSADGSSAVTGPVFTTEDWTEVDAATYSYPGSEYPTGLTGVDRTMGLYVPGVNELGLQLPLLVDGIDYPGVQVWGNYFAGNITLDADYQSQFADIYLGQRFSDINVEGGEFVGPYEGHAPEELVNGAEYDTMDMRIYTRPGSDWTYDGHGFQIQQINYTYEPAITDTYSWANIVNQPVQIAVANLTTGYELVLNHDYTVDYNNQTVTILGGVTDQEVINIAAFELGGGNQLYRATYQGQDVVADDNSVIVPVNYNEIVEFAVFQNGQSTAQPTYRPYTASIAWNLNNSYVALDIVYNDTVVVCTATNSTYSFISCNDASSLVEGQPIVFSGTVFGGIVADTTYYVLSVPNATQFFVTDVAGSTTALPLTDASGSMTGTPTGTYYRAVQSVAPGIFLSDTEYWLPFVPSQNTKVTFATTIDAADGVSLTAMGIATSLAVTNTTVTTNAITVSGSTSGISVGQTVTFSGNSIGGILAGVDYYVLTIVDSSNFTIEQTLGSGTPVALITDSAAWTGELNAKFTPTDYVSWSTIVVQNFVVNSTTVVTKTFAITDSLQGTNPANLIVAQNGLRLRPAEGIEWIGDDSSISFGLPQRGGYAQSIIDAPNDITVYVDNVLQVQSVGAVVGSYSVTNWDGSNTPGRQVVFNTAPAAGARILISVDTQAAYAVAGDQLQIVSNINIGDYITVTTWNDTTQQNILTLVFDGPTTTGITINEPYDATTYDEGLVTDDPGSYDYTLGTIIAINDFDLQRTGVRANRLWVTLNGYQLFEGSDFTVEGQYLILQSGAISVGAILAVTEFTESIVPEAVAFRIFQDMRGVQATYRMTDTTTTTLSQSVSATADTIYVVDASNLTEPNLSTGVFGIITINGERIMYRNRDTALNTISGLQRGTAGTAAAAHTIGAEVYDIGSGNLLAAEYQNYAMTDTSMGDGTTSVFYAPNIDISDFGDSSTAYVESIEVYVGGIRQYNYSETAADSQYRYIVTDFGPLAIEFITDGTYSAPAAGSEVTILQRRGLSWYQPGVNTASDGVALQETDTVAARFLCDR